MKIPIKIAARQHEITHDFLRHLDIHLAAIVSGTCEEMMEIRDIAAMMHIHPTHLSNTVKLATGKSACDFFEEKILHIAQQQLQDNSKSIAEIAMGLTYDPSNFTKFFKRFTGQTPKQYREANLLAKYSAKAEALTI